jgi:hypothetical protein
MKLDFKITELLTLPITIMAAISLASSILLFSPNLFLEKIYMLDFIEKNGFIVGIIFLVFTSILLVKLIAALYKIVVLVKKKRDFYIHGVKNLKELTDYQKTTVYILFQKDNHTDYFSVNDGAIKSLSQKKIISILSKTNMIFDPFEPTIPYVLQPWVAEKLNKKPALLSDFRDAFERQMEKNNERSESTGY